MSDAGITEEYETEMALPVWDLRLWCQERKYLYMHQCMCLFMDVNM